MTSFQAVPRNDNVGGEKKSIGNEADDEVKLPDESELIRKSIETSLLFQLLPTMIDVYRNENGCKGRKPTKIETEQEGITGRKEKVFR